MENVDVVVEDFRVIEELVRKTLAASGYEVEPQDPEVLEVQEGARKVLLAFIVKRRR